MLLNPKADPILSRFRAALDEIYGDRLERVILYGSRARGEERPDSDHDIAVFIQDPASLGDELRRLASLTTDILLDTGAVICAMPFRAGAYRERTGFMHELRNVGLDLRSSKRPNISTRHIAVSPAPRRSLPPAFRTLPRVKPISPSTTRPKRKSSSARMRPPKRIAASEANSADWRGESRASDANS